MCVALIQRHGFELVRPQRPAANPGVTCAVFMNQARFAVLASRRFFAAESVWIPVQSRPADENQVIAVMAITWPAAPSPQTPAPR